MNVTRSVARVFRVLGVKPARGAMESYLFGVTHTDPAIYAGVAIGLIALTAAVSAVPARRAARIDPVTLLRED